MKRLVILLWMGALLQICSAQTPENLVLDKIDTGRIEGVMYRIIFPPDWNHNLVMYAHGYESPQSPVNSLRSVSSRRDMGFKPFLDRGFAVARSAYSKVGWALPEGVDETEALRKYFFDKYGKPDTTFIVGHSMGGGITVATAENFSGYYQGALPLCPLAGRPYLQIKMALDMNAVVAAAFPGTMPSLVSVTNGTAPPLDLTLLRDAISKDTLLAWQIARHFELKMKDLAIVVGWNDGVLRDVSKQAGGNPIDNSNTLYTGLSNDREINLNVERIEAKSGTEWFLNRYDRTGDISIPTVLLHTIYDPSIVPSMAIVSIDNLAQQKGKQDNLVMYFTNGQAHCAFSPRETGKAFDILRKWSSSGKKPISGELGL